MQNVGLTLMLGMGQAVAAGIGGMSNTGDGLRNNTGNITPTAGLVDGYQGYNISF